LETGRLAQASPSPAAPPTPPGEAHDPLGALIARAGQPGDKPGDKTTDAPATAPKPGDATAVAKGPPPPSKQRPGGAPARKTERLIVIALDPGHGGEDPGAIGPRGTREKTVVLQIAQKLRERINAT